MSGPLRPDLPAAVLFDMDGTLIDSEGLWLQAETAVMVDLGAGWTAADQAHCLGGPLERVAAYMLERSGATLAQEAVGGLLLDRMEAQLRSAPLSWRPGARELLAEARALGVATALVSASWARLIAAVHDRMDAEIGTRAFDAVVAGDDVAQGKPHPEPYATAAALVGVPPGDCLALEDSPTGVVSALDAGCRVVAIPHIAVVDDPRAVIVETLTGESVASLWRRAVNAPSPR